ncbi:gliding motility protein GldL [Dokdonia sp. Hel_I_53]|uniref:gliding motility protein GldL n=1 Tax=Dokdonia sp. Hel_I_53 TaxID=1566287 RepID=UPI00119B8C54|nr:gliding motility protein GldL [Dokdonia sp. Hel_I_53]TVZ52567.1 hypothetical protein OD90_1745 [Dokdonia sp. Hel_I_53]
MRVKHILALLIVGFICTLLGALFKILHWMGAPQLLIAGTFIQAISGVLAIWKLFTSHAFKDFLNK